MDQSDEGPAESATMRNWWLTGGALALIVGVAGGIPASAGSPSTVTLPGDRVFPESVTSTSDGTLYVGSFAEGGVMKVAPGAEKAQPFIPPGASETRSTLGVLADEKSGTLWMCSNDLSALGVKGPSDVKGSYLKGFDLKTGQNKISAKLPDHGFCNDIAIGANGDAFISDSQAPRVLKLAQGTQKLEVFATDPQFAPPSGGKGAGLDGLAFGKDGALYVNKFTEPALFKISVEGGKAGTITKLEPSQDLVLADALRPIEGGTAFLMIEGRGKLDRVTVSGDKAKIETLKDGLNGPTGVTLTGNTAWVSEGQLPALLSHKDPKLPFDLKAVPIPTP